MYILAIFLLFSCNCFSHDGTSQRIESVSKTILFPNKDNVVEFVSPKDIHLSEIDSVRVTYWKSTEARWFVFSYSNGGMCISECFGPFEKQISDKDIIVNFLSYLDSFFITKSDKIELSKVKRDDQICSNYPEISFELFLKNKSAIKHRQEIGYEEYDVEYNPKFLEFYEFIDNLVRTP